MDPETSKGAPFRLNTYISRNRFEVILFSQGYTERNDVEYYYELFHMRQMEEAQNLNMAE